MLDSPFDDDGCLRRSCGRHDDCVTQEACYYAADFGGCVPSGTFCEDVAGECVCGGDPFCGGSHCVPLDIYPVPIEEGPRAPGVAQKRCNGSGGLAMTILLTAEDPDCMTEPEAALLRIEISSYVAVQGFRTIDGVDTFAWNAEGVAATGGHFILSNDDAGVVSGDYDLVFGDVAVVGSFAELPICEPSRAC